MESYFLDSSAIVKIYVEETGSAWLKSLVRPTEGHLLFAASITLANLEYDFKQQYRVVELSPAIIYHAVALAKLHMLRGYDAVQLAAAMKISSKFPSLTLISADTDLNKASLAEGLTIENPNDHSS